MSSLRSQQRLRTRKDILRAANKLAQDGDRPSMDAIAEEALVSRATIYRYFPNVEELLFEASVDLDAPNAETFFVDCEETDPIERIDKAEAAMHEVTYANEQILRHLLSISLVRDSDSLPVRQNRRVPLVQAALEPVRNQMKKAEYDRLCSALALVFGLESMIVFKDVHPLSSKKAREVKRWIIDSLVRATLDIDE